MRLPLRREERSRLKWAYKFDKTDRCPYATRQKGYHNLRLRKYPTTHTGQFSETISSPRFKQQAEWNHSGVTRTSRILHVAAPVWDLHCPLVDIWSDAQYFHKSFYWIWPPYKWLDVLFSFEIAPRWMGNYAKTRARAMVARFTNVAGNVHALLGTRKAHIISGNIQRHGEGQFELLVFSVSMLHLPYLNGYAQEIVGHRSSPVIWPTNWTRKTCARKLFPDISTMPQY